jgi:hypothetical protein
VAAYCACAAADNAGTRLSANSPDAFPHFTAAFLEGLSAAGFVDGKIVTIEYRWGNAHLERVPALTLDLIRRLRGFDSLVQANALI